LFAVGGFSFAAMAAVMVLTSENRLARFDVWLGRDTDPFGAARQPLHGRYALADGGWWGVGLGASREKWQWLSEPHNDFIYAIIGEELGLPGTLVVLGLFATLALVCYRLVLRTDDFFIRLAAGGVMTWIVVQAMVNIGAVIGLLPVIGVPLPLVSSGGSSLVTTMLALGMLLSFARQEPGCAEALAARPSVVRRSLAVLPVGRSRGAGR
jgi:cell division protein FtsW